MNKIEVLHFMEKIKAYYQNFSIEEYTVNEWHDRLKNYDIDDVYMKFEQHLTGEYKNEIPKLHFITRYLKTTNEKGKVLPCNFRCNRCQKIYKMVDYDFHVSRHNSVDYIVKKSKEYDFKYNEQELFQMSKKEFDELYDSFIESLYEVESDEAEKQRLKNIIFAKAGMPIETIDFHKQLNFL